MAEYEFRVLSFPREASRSDVRQALAEHAEYGRWELQRSVHLRGGARRYWLRRRVVRVASTLASA